MKHSLPVAAHFDWAVAVTLSAPARELRPLVLPGLELDAAGDHAFLAVACVQTRRLRPSFLPSALGIDFFLVGYRLFARFKSSGGSVYRGLQILGSEVDRWLMTMGGRWFTHYGYRQVRTQIQRRESRQVISTSSGLHLEFDRQVPDLPGQSVFKDWSEARRYAGPMPYTFASESNGRSIVRVEGVRTQWKPRPVLPATVRVPFFEKLLDSAPVPAAAFLVENVDYRWKRGVRERIG